MRHRTTRRDSSHVQDGLNTQTSDNALVHDRGPEKAIAEHRPTLP